jgi:hypothetical protein
MTRSTEISRRPRKPPKRVLEFFTARINNDHTGKYPERNLSFCGMVQRRRHRPARRYLSVPPMRRAKT